MKIAILMNVYSPWAHSIAETLTNLGHKVHAIDFADMKASQKSAQEKFADATQELAAKIDGVHLMRGGPRSSIRYFLAPPKVRSLLKRINPDVLISLAAGGYGQLAWASGFRPYAVYTMGSEILLLRNPIARAITRRVLRRASAVFANGDYLARKTSELGGVPAKNNLIGVDPSKFKPGQADSKILFLSNRGFKPVYNNRYIIEAFALLQSTPDFEFHFASHGVLLEETKKYARSALSPEMFARFKFWGGVSQEQMMDLLHRSRYFVSMSRSDGTATSLLEAMSCGLFPILSDIPQNRDWIDSSRKNGALIPLDEPRRLADIFEKALHDPGLHEGAREFNRNLIKERADSRQLGAKLAFLLERMKETYSQN
jgi:L-malate glycosyltransferase